jgi:hypothetical protein
MGGFGSGWWGKRGGGLTLDDLPKIDVNQWKREARLTPGSWFSVKWTEAGRITATVDVYVHADQIALTCDTAPQHINLLRTPGTLGGFRTWFACPYCKRRCAKLFLSGRFFACTECLGLPYQAQRESPGRRALRRAEKIFKKVRVEQGRPGWKLKWMRWATYHRLHDAADAVFPIIERAESAPYAAITKISAPRRKRGRPRKSTC